MIHMEPHREDRDFDRGREGRVRRLQVEVGRRAWEGEPLAEIDHDVILSSELSDESKSALWLLGWSHQEAGRDRYLARQARLMDDVTRRPSVPGRE
jgi:multidrug efflux pump subunit AcrA (membrane-fusion protein)